MQGKQSPSFSLAQTVLPWLIAGAAFVFYAFTLNRWVTFSSLPIVAKVTDWDWWTSTLYNPLLYAISYPFQFLPPGLRPVGFNLFTALCAALTLALLARSVALLPHDRTREQRRAESSELSLLSIRLAWLPPLFAVLVCGLQLSFWEHATAATGEMLDLLLFAYCLRALLEYRVDPRQSWLDKLAFVYGLGVTNNWGMIGFFPAFLTALIWIKGRSFFNLRFIIRLSFAGLLGLSLYLILPLIQLGSEHPMPFWEALRVNVGNQKFFIADIPALRFRVLLLSLTSVLPVLILGIRWPSTFGETSSLGALLTTLMFRFVHALFLIACVWVAFDPKFSPRTFGAAATEGVVQFLTFYYLGALCVGYFSGYFLLVYGTEPKKVWDRPSSARVALNVLIRGAVVLGAAAVAIALFLKNYPYIKGNNSPALQRYAAGYLEHLPRGGALVLSDNPVNLYLLQAVLQSSESHTNYMVLDTQLLPYESYRAKVLKRWPDLFSKKLPKNPDSATLAEAILDASTRKEVYYLHPSFGYYFEQFYLRPRGGVYQLHPYPANTLALPPLTAAEIDQNERYWTGNVALMKPLLDLAEDKNPTALFLSRNYSRALNFWGTEMQKMKRLEEAGKSFGAAVTLNPDNVSAKINYEFNQRLQKGQAPARDAVVSVTDRFGKHLSWLGVLNTDGPLDEPRFSFELAQYFSRTEVGLYRQAALQFDRVQILDPQHLTARYWLANMCLLIRLPGKTLELTREIRQSQPALSATTQSELLRLEALAEKSQGNLERAEKMLVEASAKFPQDPAIHETLSKLYLTSGRFQEALESINAQLKIAPDNIIALRNQGATFIQMANLSTNTAQKAKDYEKAIPPLTRALQLDPDDSAALMNRAIAHLQAGKLTEAQRDYEAMQKILPSYFPIYYGLGEVAYRLKDARRAIANYQLYLKFAPPNTEETDYVRKRLKEVRAGSFDR